MIEFNDRIRIGNEIVDSQHQELIWRFNKLYQAAQDPDEIENSVIGFIVDDLVDYTVHHFRTEEYLQKLSGFKRYAHHRKKHESFVKKIRKVQKDFSLGQVGLGEELLTFLREWIVNHIFGEDMLIGEHLKKMSKKKVEKFNRQLSEKVNAQNKFLDGQKEQQFGDSNMSLAKMQPVKETNFSRLWGNVKNCCVSFSLLSSVFLFIAFLLVVTNTGVLFMAHYSSIQIYFKLLILGGVLLVSFVLIAALVCCFHFGIKKTSKTLSEELARIASMNISQTSNLSKLKFLPNFSHLQKSIAKLSMGFENIQKFIPYEILQEMLRNARIARLHLKERYVSIFFNDIEGFTEISEKLSPYKLVDLINRFFIINDEIVTKHGGIIISYLGDGLLTIFNAPKYCFNHEKKCCLACIEILEELKKFNVENEGDLPAIKLRFGANSGKTLVGNVGSFYNLRYTCLGDFVNTVSRLEGLNKQYQSRLLIGEGMYRALKRDKDLIFRWVDSVIVKGKGDSTHSYHVAFREKLSKEETEKYEASALMKKAFDDDQFDLLREIGGKVASLESGSDDLVVRKLMARMNWGDISKENKNYKMHIK